jgi:hypothetical protein
VHVVTEQLTIKDVVAQALGEASVCWEHPERAGVFNEQRCVQVLDELLGLLQRNGVDVDSVSKP